MNNLDPREFETVSVAQADARGAEQYTRTSVRDLITSTAAEVCAAELRQATRALVLTGSFARSEATVVAAGVGWQVLGDAEFLIIIEDGSPIPDRACLASIESQVCQKLSVHDVECNVSLAAATAGYLRGLKPHIFAFELKRCGVVVSGEKDILQQVPEFDICALPLRDGFDLLMNRIVEQLEYAPAIARDRRLSPEAQYALVKLSLDMGTSLLVFLGDYAPSYRERAENMQRLARCSPGRAMPFSLPPFAEVLLLRTNQKLLGAERLMLSLDFDAWLESLDYARKLVGWERAILDDNLDRTAMYHRTVEHFRSWAALAKRVSLMTTLRQGFRWLKLSFVATPRDLVYRVATDVLFSCSLQNEAPTEDLDRLQRRLLATLPLCPTLHGSEELSLSRLAEEVLRNYHEFLVGTRT